jgi:hypothetical protein
VHLPSIQPVGTISGARRSKAASEPFVTLHIKNLACISAHLTRVLPSASTRMSLNVESHSSTPRRAPFVARTGMPSRAAVVEMHSIPAELSMINLAPFPSQLAASAPPSPHNHASTRARFRSRSRQSGVDGAVSTASHHVESRSTRLCGRSRSVGGRGGGLDAVFRRVGLGGVV